MKIIPIFGNQLFSFHYALEAFNEYRRLIEQWGNQEFLLHFLKENIADIPKGADIWKYMNWIAEESYEINETIIQISNSENKSLDEFFKPLDNSEYSIRFLSKRKGRKSVLRLYAIRIEANLYVITGGAIKLPLQHLMQDRKHTQIELNKINTAKEQLENERIFDKDSFFEFLNEMP